MLSNPFLPGNSSLLTASVPMGRVVSCRTRWPSTGWYSHQQDGHNPLTPVLNGTRESCCLAISCEKVSAASIAEHHHRGLRIHPQRVRHARNLILSTQQTLPIHSECLICSKLQGQGEVGNMQSCSQRVCDKETCMAWTRMGT